MLRTDPDSSVHRQAPEGPPADDASATSAGSATRAAAAERSRRTVLPAAPLSLLNSRWQILVVDVDPSAHQTTRLALAGTEFLGRPLQLLHATCGASARQILSEQPDVALLLLDLSAEHFEASPSLVRFVRTNLGRRALRIVVRGAPPASTGRRTPDPEALDCDFEDTGKPGTPAGSRLFLTVAAALRVYRDVRALQRSQAVMHSMAHHNAALLAAGDVSAFADEALRQLSDFAFFHAGAVVDLPGLPPGASPPASPPGPVALIASRGTPASPPTLDLPPLLLTHARVLPRLLVCEGDWFACCLRGAAGRCVVLVLQARARLTASQRHLLELFMRHAAIAFENPLLALRTGPGEGPDPAAVPPAGSMLSGQPLRPAPWPGARGQ